MLPCEDANTKARRCVCARESRNRGTAGRSRGRHGPTAHAPRGRIPLPGLPARVRFRICARRKHAPRRPAFVFVRSRHSKVHSKYENSGLCGDCDQTSQHVPQMQIRCPRVPGMRFGFMLNKRSQRNYRGTVLLRSHYRCGTLFSGTNHYHSKLARSTRMSHSRSHIGILRRLIRVYIGYPTDIRIT